VTGVGAIALGVNRHQFNRSRHVVSTAVCRAAKGDFDVDANDDGSLDDACFLGDELFGPE
jgi:hypothetical protein